MNFTEMKQKASANMVEAMQNQDVEAYKLAMEDFAKAVEGEVLEKAQELNGVNDSQVLASRGVRQLTSTESKFFEKMIEAMKSSEPKQALSNLGVGGLTMPETVIDAVLEDIKNAHPLLQELDVVNTQGAIKYLISKSSAQKAVWGALDASIVTELEGNFEEIDMTLMKLTAFVPISLPMLELGATWLENYIREILTEAIANGCEDAVVNNLKSDGGPLGMVIDFSKAGTVAGKVTTYKKQTATKLERLTPETYGAIASKLAKTDNGNDRVVSQLLFICNPTDYLTKVMPATTVLGGDGLYKNGQFPIPTRAIPCSAVKQGEAIVGLPKQYFLGVGRGTNQGRIEYSDDFKFLEDKRVYKTKMYANGKPKDNNSFVLVDVSTLKPLAIQVISTTETPTAGA